MNIIRDPLYIAEDYRLNEVLIEFESNTLKNDIEKIKRSAIIALVGDYGMGKSTALYGVQKSEDDVTHKWLQFDAWRYPERKGLWDGLVIEIAKQLGQGKKALKKVDGNKSLFGKWGSILGETFSQFGEILPKTEINKIEVDPVIAQKVTKITQKAEEIFGKSPVKRVYELERILADILVSVKEEMIYIVVEDVDRSGLDGLNFLETLNFFIKNNEQIKESGKKFIVIAPIATANYKESKDSYYKCIDVMFEFMPKVESAKRFIEQVFTDESLGGDGHPYLENVEVFINGLFENTSYGMNIRKLKAIIRQTTLRYEAMSESYDNVDWRAVFVFEVMKNIRAGGSTELTMFEKNALGRSHLSNKDIFTGFLMSIHMPSQPIYTYRFSNRRLPEDRIINPHIQDYKFFEYNKDSHGNTSVWIGRAEDGLNTSGYIAEYYRR